MKPRLQSILEESKHGVRAPEKREIFAERDGLCLYRTDRRDLVVQEFSGPEGGNRKRSEPKGVIGPLRNDISAYLFEYLKGFHIPTHFVGPLNGAEMLVRFTDPLPLIVRIYNTPEEELTNRLGWSAEGDGAPLEFPVVEHYFVRPDGTSAWVNEYHVYAMNLATPEELKQLNRISLKVNAVLRGLCDRRELALTHMTLGFGRYNGQILLIDELSPTTCRFVDVSHGPGRGKHSFRVVDAGNAEAVEGLCGRLKLNI